MEEAAVLPQNTKLPNSRVPGDLSATFLLISLPSFTHFAPQAVALRRLKPWVKPPLSASPLAPVPGFRLLSRVSERPRSQTARVHQWIWYFKSEHLHMSNMFEGYRIGTPHLCLLTGFCIVSCVYIYISVLRIQKVSLVSNRLNSHIWLKGLRD